MSLPSLTRTRTWGHRRSSGIGTELAPAWPTRHNVVAGGPPQGAAGGARRAAATEHRVRVTCYARDLGSVGEREALVADLRAPGGW